MQVAGGAPPSQVNVQLPLHLQDYMNRICSTLNAQRRRVEEVFRPLLPENQQGVTTYRQQDFTDQAGREFHLKNAEAAQLASHFAFSGNPNYVDFGKFSAVVQSEQLKFTQLLQHFDVELRLLQDSLRSRHTGTYKWFQTHARTFQQENCLSYDEFMQAIKSLNCPQVVDNRTQMIFQLLDRQGQQKVPITEIEGLFKEHIRRNNTHIQPKEIVAAVIRAFNGDIAFIERELQALAQRNMNNLSDEEATRFFKKFHGYTNHYTDQDLVVLVDFYVKSAGRFELHEFIDAMNAVFSTNQSVRPNPQMQGIHMMAAANQPAGAG